MYFKHNMIMIFQILISIEAVLLQNFFIRLILGVNEVFAKYALKDLIY